VKSPAASTVAARLQPISKQPPDHYFEARDQARRKDRCGNSLRRFFRISDDGLRCGLHTPSLQNRHAFPKMPAEAEFCPKGLLKRQIWRKVVGAQNSEIIRRARRGSGKAPRSSETREISRRLTR
jgi:hypothetical protein